ncbi:hypothetical protein V8C34DRAFT_241417 [Trichoderma compactum]
MRSGRWWACSIAPMPVFVSGTTTADATRSCVCCSPSLCQDKRMGYEPSSVPGHGKKLLGRNNAGRISISRRKRRVLIESLSLNTTHCFYMGHW